MKWLMEYLFRLRGSGSLVQDTINATFTHDYGDETRPE